MLSILQLSVVAQKVYFKGHVGYDIGVLKSQMNLHSDHIKDYYDSTVTTSVYQAKKSSYASGVSFDLGLGIMINKRLSAEVAGFYTVCKEQKFATEIHMEDELGYHFSAYSDYTLQGTSYGLRPSLVYAIQGTAFRPYVRVGAVISFSDLKESMKMDVSTDSPNYLPYGGMEYTLQYRKGLSAGASISLGLEYMFLSRLWVYADVSANIVNYYPAGAKYTSYVVSRHDITERLTTHEREMVFVDSYSTADNKSPNEPTKMLPVHYSFSTIGFNIGLKYTLFD